MLKRPGWKPGIHDKPITDQIVSLSAKLKTPLDSQVINLPDSAEFRSVVT